MQRPPRLRSAGLRSALAGPFDLELEAGECIAVSGASGSGKSLLLRMIADLDPNQGEVWLDGNPRSGFAPPAWRRQVAYAAAESGWWHEGVAGHFPDLAAARMLAARLGLKAELLDGLVQRLSTGEKQRLALVRALLTTPAVLLLDEPTGPLDEVSVVAVEAVLREQLTGGIGIVLVTHDLAQALRLSTRRFVMRDGKLHNDSRVA